MRAEDKLQFDNVITQTIDALWLTEKSIALDVLRLDKIHPVISGNKWFKLKYYLQDFIQQNLNELGTFGGAYSNHIVATAYAAFLLDKKSIGIIRGEKPSQPSHTLIKAQEYGMQLHFVSREAFNNKENIKQQFNGIYWIDEGGYGNPGVKGAKEILSLAANAGQYSHIICATGTGTMLAGICEAASSHQKIIGISVLKNNFSIKDEVSKLTGKDFTMMHNFHFGGYAKHPPVLIDFMNEIWQQHQLPTDIVYTSKTLYAIRQLAIDLFFPEGSKILMIHSGGLQGNLSLRPGVLPFL